MAPVPALPPQPPAIRRAATESRPFALIFAAYPQHPEQIVAEAIERHKRECRRSVTVASVGELIGRVPMPVAPKTVPTDPVLGQDAEIERRHLERVSVACALRPTDRLAEKIVRCMNHPGLTAGEAAQYQADRNRSYTFASGRTERLIQGWGYLPASNRYEAECGE